MIKFNFPIVIAAIACALFMSAPAAAAEISCDALVVISKEPVCREEFVPADTSFIDALEVPDDRKKEMKGQIDERNLRRMEALLWEKALVKKFGEKAVTPTEAEVSEFRNHLKSSMTTSYEADKGTIAYIKEVLKTKNLAPENTKKLEDILKQAENGVHFYEERQKKTEALPEEYKFVADTAETEIARNMISRWKSDKILYETYKGRLVLGQDGPQPVDAYAEFLKYIDKNMEIYIQDSAYEDIFKDMRAFAVTPHDLPAGDSDINKNFFTSPTWQLSLSNNSNRIDELKKWVESLPQK